MDDLSITIKIGGKLEKSFNETIRAAQSSLAGLNAAVSKEMSEVGDISTAAAMKMADAGKIYAGASRDMAAAGRAGASASRRMATEGIAAAASSRDIASAGGGAASTFRDMATEGVRAADAIADIASSGKVSVSSVKEISSALKGVVTGFRDVSAQSGKASKDLLAGGKEVVNLSKDLLPAGKGTVNLSKDLGKAGEMAGAASKGFMVAGAAIAATVAVAATVGKVIKEVAEYSVQVGKEFETSMSDAAATADASTEEFAKMEQAAMEMGKTTSKTAAESADALKYMSLAGWDVETSVSALPSVLKMSEASGMELGQTSDLVTDSMAALGVTVEQLPGYLDIATKAQTKSNQSAQQLMEAYIGVGGTMKNLNVPIEESATALGVLANRGIKGSEGGNALNAVMVNLTTGSGQAGKMMQELGVSAFDQQGKFIGLEATLQKLDTALQGYSEEQRNAALAAIGGKQHMDALNALMAGLNTTNEEGISEWAALTNELEDCNGSLQKMRDVKLDNLEGDLKTLESATQDAGIKIYKHLNGPMRELTQFKIKAVYDASDALESDGFAGMAMSAGNSLAEGIGMVVERLPEFLVKAVVSTGSFLVGFATELPASLLKGIIKGVPRLLRALPGIGVDIVKAIIKGIFSIGGAPLKAIGSLFFDGGDDKKIKDAGGDIAEVKASGISDDMAAAADIPQAPQPAQAESTDPVGPIPSVEGAEPIPVSTPMDTVPLAEGVSDDIADIGSQGAGIVQASADIPMDIVQPADGTDAMMADIPVATDVVPALQEMGDSGISIPSEGKGGQAPISTKEIPVEPLMSDMDMMGMDADIAVPPIAAGQDIVQTPPWTATDIPIGDLQVSDDIAPGIPIGAAQVSPDIMPDMSVGGGQALTGAAQMLTDIVPDMGRVGDVSGVTGISDITPDAATAVSMEGTGGQAMADVPVQGTVVSQPEDTDIGKIRIPRAGIDMTGIGDGIAQAGDALSTGAVGSMAEDIHIPHIGVDGTALSDRTGAVGALDGIGKAIRGTIDTLQAGTDMSGIDAGGIAQMPQAPQIPQTPLQGAMPGVALPDAVPDMGSAQDMAKGAVGAPGVSPQAGSIPAVEGMRGPREDKGTISGWLQDLTDTIRTILRVPDGDIPSGRSVVDETLDMITGRDAEHGMPSASGSPTFIYSPTITVEGGSDVKKDVEEANRLGMREFDKMMRQWMKQNKRTGFA